METTKAGDIQIDTMEAGYFGKWSRMNPDRRVLSVQYQIRHLYINSSGGSAQGKITSQEMVMVVSREG